MWERGWRLLGAAGLAALATGQALWTAYQIVDPAAVHSLSADDIAWPSGIRSATPC